MEGYLVWLIIGFVLVIAEMATSTFYLLVLGVTAFVAAALAWFGASFGIQVLVAVIVGVVGCIWISVKRRAEAAPPMRALDVGQPVAFDAWISQSDRRARVRYRDALWDAHISGDCRGDAGEVLYITAVRGNTLEVDKRAG